MKLCICGIERSGTTAVARIIAKASGMSLLLDPREAYRACFEMLEFGKLNENLDQGVRKCDIVKVPNFAAILPQLKEQYGEFAVLIMLRDPRDVICSIRERVKDGPPVPHLPIFWTPPSTGVAAEDQVNGICQRWCEFVEGGLRFKGKRVFLTYEDWYRDKLNALRGACSKLDVQFDPSKITRGDLERQHNKNINSRPNPIVGPGRWIRELGKEDNDKVIAICGKLMQELCVGV